MKSDSQPADPLYEQLARLVQAIDATGKAVLPGSDLELLQSIVDAAARIFGAAAASIALVDEEEQMLEFRVAYGAGNQSLVGMRIPIDKGIAGYVALTGQPIAISDVHKDTRFNQDFAKSTGYVPRSILATPLLFEERVIGVMEVLDKISAPSFGLQDMELLGIFARQAALAIHQSQQTQGLSEALVRGLRELAIADNSEALAELFSRLAEEQRDQGQADDLLSLAGLIHDISAMGEAERKACLDILSVFRQYRQKRGPRF
jgi:GAF domain-containing protein